MNIHNYFYITLLLSFSLSLKGHNTGKPHEHTTEATPVRLSEKDIKFVMENKEEKLAYIPDIVLEMFVLLKDFSNWHDYNKDLQMFINVIDTGCRVVYRQTALAAIFGALSVLKNYEAQLPTSYMNQMCDILYGYQKSLHKEELVVQGLDSLNNNQKNDV